jgi:hypothetical protein
MAVRAAMIVMCGSGVVVFSNLDQRNGRVGAVLAAVPAGLVGGYGAYWMFAQIMPLLRWLVARGVVQEPDETKFRDKILWTACWKEEPAKKNDAGGR